MRLFIFVTVASILGLAFESLSAQQEAESDQIQPASESDAASVLDLRKYVIPKAAELVGDARLASVHFRMRTTAKEAFAAVRKQLNALGCTELDGTYETEDYCSSMFSRNDYRVTVSVLPGSEPGEINVAIDNLGNVELEKIPRPEKTSLQFANAAMAMYQSDESVDAVKKKVEGLMTQAGWEPYGVAGDQLFFRNRCVIASVNCMSAPAQAGKTVLQYSSQLASVEIPLPPKTLRAQYADVTQELSFSTKDDRRTISKFYVEGMAGAGWKPTSEEPVLIDFDYIQLFRNKEGRFMRLEIKEIKDEGRLDVRMKIWAAATTEKK